MRSQSTNDETVLAEQSDYVWDPECSHVLFVNKPTDTSNQALSTSSIHNDYVKMTHSLLTQQLYNIIHFYPTVQETIV